MNSWLLTVVYTVLPCLIAAYAAALYLTPRSIPPRTAWSTGLLIAVLLTAGVTSIMRDAAGGMVPLSRLIAAYAALYGIPFVVLTAAAVIMRRRATPRALGLVVLVVLFLGIGFLSRYASGHFVDFVNACC